MELKCNGQNHRIIYYGSGNRYVIGGKNSVTPLFQGRVYIPGYKQYKTCQLGDYMLPTTQTTFEPEKNSL